MRSAACIALLHVASPLARRGAVRRMHRMGSAVMSEVPKVLCLHGGGTNEAIMRLQTAKLRRNLREDAQFEFIEGAHEMLYVDPAVEKRFDPPFFSWYDVQHDAVCHILPRDAQCQHGTS